MRISWSYAERLVEICYGETKDSPIAQNVAHLTTFQSTLEGAPLMKFSWQSISLDSIWMKVGPYEGEQLMLLRPYPRTLGLSLVNRVE